MLSRWTVAGVLLALAAFAEEPEDQLRRFFEGKQVVVKIDMPATKDGIDIQYAGPQPINFREYSNRIKNHGVSLRSGDRVMITTVKVKDNLIEFQLGGGGWGTLSDHGPSMVTPRVAGKSSRERDLERDIRNETDSRRRRDMERELSRLRDRRERDDREERLRAEEINSARREEIRRLAANAGSRFNLRFQKGYLKERPATADLIQQALAEWVDFGPLAQR